MSGLSFKRMKTSTKIQEIEEVVYSSLKLDVNKIQEEGAADYINSKAESDDIFDELEGKDINIETADNERIEGSETSIDQQV